MHDTFSGVAPSSARAYSLTCSINMAVLSMFAAMSLDLVTDTVHAAIIVMTKMRSASKLIAAKVTMPKVTYICIHECCRSVATEFVVPKLPWLIEALGAILLDGSIVFQILYYRRTNRNKPPPDVPASVNPLGTIAL